MLDEFKIMNPDIDFKLLRKVLDFPFLVGESTSTVIHKPLTVEGPRGIKFRIGPNEGKEFVHIEGSFHKYRNNGKHNYDDFFLSEVPGTVLSFCDTFRIPLDTVINNLAFGINLIVPFDPDIIMNHFIMYKDTPFQRMEINKGKGSGIICKTSQFIIKIYNKGKQYGLSEFIIRIEIKVTTMQFFTSNKVNIKTLQDLLSVNNLITLPDLLQRYFDDILVCVPNTDHPGLSEKHRLLLAKGQRSTYWSEMRTPGQPDYGKQRKRYDREMKIFKSIVSDLKGDILHKTVSEIMKTKLDIFRADPLLKMGANLATCIQDPKHEKGANLDIYYTTELPQDKTRTCKTCGKDISHQKPGSIFCSEKINGKEGKKCRNAYNNPKLNPRNHILQRLARRQGPALFPFYDYAVLTPDQQRLLDRPNSIYNRNI